MRREALAIRLVPAAALDAEALAALVNAAFAVYPFLTQARTSAEGLRDELGPDGEMLLAESQGALVACAMVRDAGALFGPGHERPPGVPERALYLGLVSVQPGRMRGGAGASLYAAAERLARERGYAAVVLGTVREMDTVPYWEAHGFAVVEEQLMPAGHWGMAMDFHYSWLLKPL